METSRGGRRPFIVYIRVSVRWFVPPARRMDATIKHTQPQQLLPAACAVLYCETCTDCRSLFSSVNVASRFRSSFTSNIVFAAGDYRREFIMCEAVLLTVCRLRGRTSAVRRRSFPATHEQSTAKKRIASNTSAAWKCFRCVRRNTNLIFVYLFFKRSSLSGIDHFIMTWCSVQKLCHKKNYALSFVNSMRFVMNSSQ